MGLQMQQTTTAMSEIGANLDFSRFTQHSRVRDKEALMALGAQHNISKNRITRWGQAGTQTQLIWRSTRRKWTGQWSAYAAAGPRRRAAPQHRSRRPRLVSAVEHCEARRAGPLHHHCTTVTRCPAMPRAGTARRLDICDPGLHLNSERKTLKPIFLDQLDPLIREFKLERGRKKVVALKNCQRCAPYLGKVA